MTRYVLSFFIVSFALLRAVCRRISA